jgi:hypothetical protein
MARKQKTIHYLYKTTCLVTGRYYIGMHSTSNLDDGYMGSGRRLTASIRKHGVDNHKKEIIEFFDTRELLVEAEKKVITPEMITDKNCMNLKGGGEGGFISEEQQRHRSECGGKALHLKLKTDKQFKQYWSEQLSNGLKESYKSGKRKNYILNGFKNKKHSEETKKLIGEKNSTNQQGYNNSQYGSCWITNEIENKKIMKGDLIPDGWRLGRKIKK